MNTYEKVIDIQPPIVVHKPGEGYVDASGNVIAETERDKQIKKIYIHKICDELCDDEKEQEAEKIIREIVKRLASEKEDFVYTVNTTTRENVERRFSSYISGMNIALDIVTSIARKHGIDTTDIKW